MDELQNAAQGLGQTVLGVSLGQWLLMAVLGVGLFLASWGLARLLQRHFTHRAAEQTEHLVDDVAVLLCQRLNRWLLVFIAFYLALVLAGFPEPVVTYGAKVATLALLIQLVVWGNAGIDLASRHYLDRSRQSDSQAPATGAEATTANALAMIARLVLVVLVLLLALQNLGIEVASLIASLGVGGIAVALAIRSILSDLFASLTIAFDKPFVVGDFLIVGDSMGTVEHIGYRSTRLRALSGEQLVFPNGDLLASRIQNYSPMTERRVAFTAGVVYRTPKAQLQRIPQLLQAAVEACDGVRFDRAHFKAFGPSSLDFEVVYYVESPDYNRYMDVQQAINLAIVEAFAQGAIEFAFPSQSVYLEAVPEVLAVPADAGASTAEGPAATQGH